MKNQSVVIGQRNRVDGKVIEFGLPEVERRLHVAPALLLAQDVGDVVRTERAGGVGFAQRGGDGFGAVFANQSDQFANLTHQGSVRVGQPA